MKMKMRELLQSMRKTTDYFIVKKIFDLEPKLPVVIGIQALADAVMPFVSVILLKEIIDALAGRQPVSRLGLYLGILLGAGAVAVLVKRWIGGRVPDQLDDDVGVGGDLHRVGRQQRLVDPGEVHLIGIQAGHADQLDRTPDAGSEFVLLLHQQTCGL